MICPHCSTSLKQKERTGNRCGSCRKRFALDPKTNALLVHDLRLRRLVDKLAGGRLYYTSTQLWFAAARKTLVKDQGSGLVWTAAPMLIGIVGTIGGVAAGNVFWVIVAPIVFLIGFLPLVLRLTGRTQRRVRIRMDLHSFRRSVLGEWTSVYGAELPGLVHESMVAPRKPPPDAILAVVCADRSVLACLQVNGVPERFGVALADSVNQVPPDLPVALLHDASLAGYVLLTRARSRRVGRPTIDGGLRPRTAMAAKGAVRLRDTAPPPDQIEWLRSTGLLTEAELTWLAKGWWSPIAAIRPAPLITRVEALARQARNHDPDPDRRAAASVGFLTWPS
jgi:hypothetical protein